MLDSTFQQITEKRISIYNDLIVPLYMTNFG